MTKKGQDTQYTAVETRAGRNNSLVRVGASHYVSRCCACARRRRVGVARRPGGNQVSSSCFLGHLSEAPTSHRSPRATAARRLTGFEFDDSTLRPAVAEWFENRSAAEAKYGAIGAVIAIPVPFVGPVLGALVGAGVAYARRDKI